MKSRYALAWDAWYGYHDFLLGLIGRTGAGRICEIGAGANPTLSVDECRELRLEYTLLDISSSELAKAPDHYHKVQADICRPLPNELPKFDLVFSKMLAEHVPDPVPFHRNVLQMLDVGGRAFHFFPTLYSPPFVVNFLLPELISQRILPLLQGNRDANGNHGKFPAYYQWCRGPSRRLARRFTKIGFEVEEMVGFFGHSGSATCGPGYYDRVPMLRRFHEALCRGLVRLPCSFLCSYAYLVLRKPRAMGLQENTTRVRSAA